MTILRSVFLVAMLIGVLRSGAASAPQAPPAAANDNGVGTAGSGNTPGSAQAAQQAADVAQKAAATAQQAATAASQAANQAVTAATNAEKSAKQSTESAGKGASTAQSAGDVAAQAAASAQQSAADVQKAKTETQVSTGMAAALADVAKKSALDADASAGVALNGSTNVKDNITIQSVLLPYKQTRKVFSKEIADHYAVVQITISNQSKDAAFLLHSAFLDYSKWALSGGLDAANNPCQQSSANSQVANCPSQVASVESRVIRSELQDAANWTWRNGLIRAAILVGSAGSAIPAFHSTNAVKYVGAYNGQFVPGVQVLFPDTTIPQLNRVSDFGFQNNKVIAKDNADIVYAFFPVERFLTPGIGKIFLRAPAIFFAPPQLFIDRHIGGSWRPWPHLNKSDVNEVKGLIENLANDACQASDIQDKIKSCPDPKEEQPDKKMLELLMTDCTCPVPADNGANGQSNGESCNSVPPACAAARPVQKLIRSISLNSINVMVQGTMTVDITTVPGQIDPDGVTFGTGNGVPASWETTGKPIDIVIKGRYLTNAVLEITSIEPPPGNSSVITDYLDSKTITLVTDDSTDTRLHCKLQWTKAIPNASKLHLDVTKTDPKDPKKTAIKSMDFVVAVSYVPSPQAISKTP